VSMPAERHQDGEDGDSAVFEDDIELFEDPGSCMQSPFCAKVSDVHLQEKSLGEVGSEGAGLKRTEFHSCLPIMVEFEGEECDSEEPQHLVAARGEEAEIEFSSVANLSCSSSEERNDSSIDLESAVCDFSMELLVDHHTRLKEHMSNFVQEQRRRLVDHQETVEGQFVQQRFDMMKQIQARMEQSQIAMSEGRYQASVIKQQQPQQPQQQDPLKRKSRQWRGEKRTVPPENVDVTLWSSDPLNLWRTEVPPVLLEQKSVRYADEPEELELRPTAVPLESWSAHHISASKASASSVDTRYISKLSGLLESPWPTIRNFSDSVRSAALHGPHPFVSRWVGGRLQSEVTDSRASKQRATDNRASRTREAYEDIVSAYRRPESKSNSFGGAVSKALTSSARDRARAKHDEPIVTQPRRLVESRGFAAAMAVIICLNGVHTASTLDMTVRGRASDPHDSHDFSTAPWAMHIQVGFLCTFLGEILLRVLVQQGSFCVGRDWRWNLFDTTVVSGSVLEMFLWASGVNESLVYVRLVRSLNLVRLVRYARVFHKLRMMTMAIVNCSMMLMWAVLVLLLLFFMFSIVFLNGVSQFLHERANDESVFATNMKLFFGSLPMSMLTLFMVVTGGVDWWEIAEMLLEIHLFYLVAFVLFVMFSVIAVLNVINAIFVNDAMETARNDMDLRAHGEIIENRFVLEQLTSLFKEMLPTGEFALSQEAFVKQVDNTEMRVTFALIGVTFTDGPTLFKLLDVNDDGEVGIDEFVVGCLRLKGGAFLMDMSVLVTDTKKLIHSSAKETKAAIGALSLALHSVDLKLERMI